MSENALELIDKSKEVGREFDRLAGLPDGATAQKLAITAHIVKALGALTHGAGELQAAELQEALTKV